MRSGGPTKKGEQVNCYSCDVFIVSLFFKEFKKHTQKEVLVLVVIGHIFDLFNAVL